MNAQVSEVDTLRAQVAALTATLAAKSTARGLSFRVTQEKLNEKTGKVEGKNGAISIYGLGQWPTTLYVGQWERIIAHVDDLKAFISANETLLSRKQ